jgi:hypothetical protein
MAKVIERARARYEVEDVEYGKVYRWKPESLLVECECGEMVTLTHSETTCEKCGAEHAAIVGEALHAGLQDTGDRPWRYLQPCTPTQGA